MTSSFLFSLALFVLMAVRIGVGDAGNVTYDGRSLIIDGQHKILFSGSIHYPRSTPEMWPSLIAKAKSGGIDVIDTYVFWNIHEPQQGQFDFSGRRDIVRFIKEIQAQGLYVCLRIGPFIQAEWSYGGLPFWLHNVEGIVFRTDNEPFKYYMKRYAQMIVNLMKSENLYASQGGPIILSQIENEYGMIGRGFGQAGKSYVKWAANLAVELDTGVPWVMCKQDDAPDPVINACNGRQCGQTFKGPNSPNKPAIWTENWTSFYQTYGEEPLMRSAEDIAFHVALFIAKKNGSFVNYYMYHGGTNFGRNASQFVTTSYYDQAPLDEYGLLRQPKWGHLKELHAAIKLCEKPLLSGLQRIISLGKLQTAFVFGDNTDLCAAFLVNQEKSGSTVQFLNSSYLLSPKSISVLPDCKNVAFNTAKVNALYSTRTREPRQNLSSPHMWEEFTETVPSFSETSIRSESLLEHMNTTQDTSDYLWQIFRFQPEEAASILKVNQIGHALHAFVNGRFIGSMHGAFRVRRFSLEKNLSLLNGTNSIALLSVMVGLPNSGAHLERRVVGSRSVELWNSKQAVYLNNYSWGYQVGLHGEQLNVYTDHGAAKVQWKQYTDSNRQPLTWYKASFNTPEGKDPVALNLGSMGKGEAWVNGQSIGRYWVSFHTSMGSPSQTWYHIPRSFLNPNSNLLVILEEEQDGNPLGITIDTVSVTEVCAHVSNSHPPPVNFWRKNDHNRTKDGHMKHWYDRRPKVHLQCSDGKKISKVLFASFGTPNGNCWGYSVGRCHSPNSVAVVEKACLSKSRCSVTVLSKSFGGVSCPHTVKSLLVHAQCS